MTKKRVTPARSEQRTEGAAQNQSLTAGSLGHLQKGSLASQLHTSPRMLQQRESIAAAFGTANPRGLVIQRVHWDEVEHDRIEIKGEGGEYTAYYDGLKCGELTLYEDDAERNWINNISVDKQYQGKGIGLSLLQKAVDEHTEIYAAVGMTKNDAKDDGDTRYLSVEGAAAVNSAVRNGILKEEWCLDPSQEFEIDFEMDFDDDNEMDESILNASQMEAIDNVKKGKWSMTELKAWAKANEPNDAEAAILDVLRSADR